MRLNKSSQLVLVGAAGLAVASLVTACSQVTQTLTVDFVFVASSKAAGSNNYGEINVFEIDSESGHMRQIPDSPFPSEGRDPVAEAVSSDYGSLFVVNQDDNTVVQFVIGTDGKLYPFYTLNPPGVYPLGIATDAADMFVLETYQPLPTCSTAAPCSGSLAVFPLTAATKSGPVQVGSAAVNPSLDTNYWPLTLSGTQASDVIVPTGVSVLGSGSYVYVTAYDSSVTPHVGYIFGFAVGSGGVLTALSGSPYAAGVQPSAIATNSTASTSYVYATDFANNDVLGYTVSSSTGALAPMTTGTGGGNTFPSGNQPTAIAVDPSFPFVYVTNSLDASMTGYSVSNGALTPVGTYATGLDPVAIGIDPSTNHFVYSVNFLGNNVSGFELNETDGTLLNTQYSPYSSNALPTAVAAIPHNGTGAGVH
ncbi:MAG TPA: beta-propeller fold lactonase family protein [Terracidiphilus sp.]|nr:beta-propeller fold lactonase family protein [Terracidiphilus sp.]